MLQQASLPRQWRVHPSAPKGLRTLFGPSDCEHHSFSQGRRLLRDLLIAAHITRVDEDVFEIIVLRGFAEILWDDLARMCAEYV
ncbi:sarcosine oxidase, gamma subunit family, heterotetrameric form [Rhizobium tibeticum]|uniref:Sarcosine oxidase, gamma subunit family n=1 Tax=Rhizobium tibeticum TaxID=501024 RepID=A0A1H8PKE5_9HYPH|nr:sarcosine oxidase, gamma subunit family [Rhizobium tibeticum]SEO42479.1 sarcosine oxidase, gamma subunit family, heterotetrameric form [Rhizobium tibeticum]